MQERSRGKTDFFEFTILFLLLFNTVVYSSVVIKAKGMQVHPIFSNLDIVENIVSFLPLMEKLVVQSVSSVFQAAAESSIRNTKTLMITDQKGSHITNRCHQHQISGLNRLICSIKDETIAHNKLKTAIEMMPKLEVVDILVYSEQDFLRQTRIMILKNNLDRRTLKCFHFQGNRLWRTAFYREIGPLHQPTTPPTATPHLPLSLWSICQFRCLSSMNLIYLFLSTTKYVNRKIYERNCCSTEWHNLWWRIQSISCQVVSLTSEI